MDVIVKKEDDEESVITLEDFPFICRICLMRNDLRLFEEEESLFKLFHSITKIEVRSLEELPKRICNDCITKLEEISLFVEIAKNNFTILGLNLSMEEALESKSSHECPDDHVPQTCRICFSSCDLTSFEEHTRLIQPFQNLTGLDVESEINMGHLVKICDVCIEKFNNISSFISSAVDNDKQLEKIIGEYVAVKIENCSNLTGTELLPDSDSKLESTVVSNENECKPNAFDFVTKKKCEIIDIKEEIIDSELDPTNHQNELKEEQGLQLTPAFHNKKNKYKCDICEKSFFKKNDILRHIFIHTGGEKPHKCTRCDKSFAMHSDLKRHLKTHNEKKPYKCDFCEKRFHDRSNLRPHLRTHTGEKPYKCDYCDKRFTNSSHLKIHVRFHTGEKPYICDSCGKRYTKPADLRIHMRTHTGEKPYKCVQCEKSFGSSSALRTHIRTHSEERAYKCARCDKTYITSSYLSTHMLTHTGEKPHKCSICDRSFSIPSYLKKHLRTHT